MTTEELVAACNRLKWTARDLADHCLMGEWVAEGMISGEFPVWEDVAEEMARRIPTKANIN